MAHMGTDCTGHTLVSGPGGMSGNKNVRSAKTSKGQMSTGNYVSAPKMKTGLKMGNKRG